MTLSLERKSTSQSWGFRVVGGTDVELILQVDLVRKTFLMCVYFLSLGFDLKLNISKADAN